MYFQNVLKFDENVSSVKFYFSCVRVLLFQLQELTMKCQSFKFSTKIKVIVRLLTPYLLQIQMLFQLKFL